MPIFPMDDVGRLTARLTVSFLLWFHAYGFLRGDPGIPNAVAAFGLPPSTAYLAMALEIVGPMMMVLGIYTRLGALVVALFMVAAITMYHVVDVPGLHGSGFHLTKLGTNPAGTHVDKYFLETQAFYLFGSLTVALLGQGRFGLGIGGRWN